MDPFDFGRSVGDFWAAQGKALLKAQEQAGQAMAEGMQALAAGSLPAVSSATDLSAGAAELMAASRSVVDLWSAATALSGSLTQVLPPGDGPAEATLRKMLDPGAWLSGGSEMGDVLGRMANGPRLADLWDVERRYARVLQAWMVVRRTGLEHNAVVLGAWTEAGRRFSEELAGLTSADAKAPDAKAAAALWTETANRQLLETQRSEPFLRTQTAMIRATTDLRLAQQDLVEHFGKQYGFPTRTELDDVHRTVTQLRRELRAMRRERAAIPQPQPQPVAQAAPARPRRSAKRS